MSSSSDTPKAIAAEQVLELFDSYWFETTIFSIRTPSPSSSRPNNLPQHTLPRPPLRRETVLWSLSDQSIPSTSLSFCSQNSPPKKLPTLPSEEKRARRRRRLCRRMSELEIREVKGFMDLGFVFAEEDTESSRLVSLIPGLQRLRRRETEEEEEEDEIRRPYLSEAWGILDQRKKKKKGGKENSLLNWRVPNLGSTDEIVMKHNLRFWAHTVASILT